MVSINKRLKDLAIHNHAANVTGGCDLGIKYEIEGLLGSVEQMLTLTAS